MEQWLKISLLLCTFGFFKEIRPSEPYVTHFLVGPWKNLTQEQVLGEIYPIGTYSHLALLVVIFLVTDLLRHKAVLIFEGLVGTVIYAMLIWAEGVPAMQVVQVLYGSFMAAEVAYYTYLYARVDPEKFHLVSSHTRASYLLGRFASGVLAQVLVSTEAMDYLELNYITLGAMGVTTVLALLLPPAKSSLYFHRINNNTRSEINSEISDSMVDEPDKKNQIISKRQAFVFLFRDLRAAYTNASVVKWSLWWALATCGFYQVLNYTQLLWEEIIAVSHQPLYNGAVEAAYTIISAACALGLGATRLNWSILGTPALAICALLQAVSVFIISSSTDLWVAYACYIVCLVAYQTLVTIASAEIAKELPQESYGLIFGLNMFVALALQSVLTAIVLTWLQLAPRVQFVVYGSYFAFLGAAFVGVSFANFWRGDFSRLSHDSLWLAKPSAS